MVQSFTRNSILLPLRRQVDTKSVLLQHFHDYDEVAKKEQNEREKAARRRSGRSEEEEASPSMEVESTPGSFPFPS